MKKFIAYSVLAFGAWLAVTSGWAIVSYATGLPGPAAVTSGALGIGADVAGSVDLPFPFSKAQHVTVRQLHRSQRFVERVNHIPERLVQRLLDRAGIRHAYAHQAHGIALAPLASRDDHRIHRIRLRAPRVSVVIPNQERVTTEVAEAMAEVRAELAAELSGAQEELIAARLQIEAWDNEAVREEVIRELQDLDLEGLKLEIDAELESLAEELQRLELDMSLDVRTSGIEAAQADLERFRLELDAVRRTRIDAPPTPDVVTD